MQMKKAFLALVFLLVTTLQQTIAQTRIPLWDDNVPGATGTSSNDTPLLEVFQPNPSSANGAAILVVPGGSYSSIVKSEANAAVAYWLPKGFVLAILYYRVAPYKYPIPMWDVKRAMRIVRNRANEWNVIDSSIGILGYSAGGHLSAYLATHYDGGNPVSTDMVERQSCKPSFSIFVYPVITMDATFTHKVSRRNIIGSSPSSVLVESLSNDKNVTKDTPPTFLVHGTVDGGVPWQNSQFFMMHAFIIMLLQNFTRLNQIAPHMDLDTDVETGGYMLYMVRKEWLP